MHRIVDRLNFHVRGIGTIGEPIVNMLCDIKNHHPELGSLIGRITFSKGSPRGQERVEILQSKGALFAVNDEAAFSRLFQVDMSEDEARRASDTIFDCTPTDGARTLKGVYSDLIYTGDTRTKRVVAQGSENGFGFSYVNGISAESELKNAPLVQIKSCNTTAMSAVANGIVDTVGSLGPTFCSVSMLDFTCIRRANDIYQSSGSLSINAGANSGAHGTHHGTDVKDVLQPTAPFEGCKFSSRAFKVPTQFMHAISFNMALETDAHLSTSSMTEGLLGQDRLKLTNMSDTCQVFGLGRDYGYMGRNLEQAVVPVDSLRVSKNLDTYQVSGAIFTPQDSNTLINSLVTGLVDYVPMDGDQLWSNLYGFFNKLGTRNQ